jgi:hypothetical protein
MEKLFAAIDAEEARAPRRKRSFDLSARISEFLSGFAPRTLAWSAAAAAVAILLQAAVITSVLVKDNGPDTYKVASAGVGGEGAIVVRFAPQATATEIANFLGAYKATVVDGPSKAGQLYSLKLSEKPTADEVRNIIREMQAESKIVSLVAQKE